ncbi:hypothetical protein SAMN02745975_00746 [Geosporobacter subterraneus DSM 17957]|uniref:Uncharacterized protein n=1 Tax=Geosporobacter subterraneus DSM 17957 TaxID=1121919 RepID=A0A1M6EHD8_9FIRM|nr:hypothetical protein [Geosporobacter subterraneus]SHI84885.1 hypothetical protein SAMN02745975_00746 [Geosporobacter subterraneus DSM 17957]
MSNNNIEKIKKLLEEKKKTGNKKGIAGERPNKQIGRYQKAFKNTKRGGLTDK